LSGHQDVRNTRERAKNPIVSIVTGTLSIVPAVVLISGTGLPTLDLDV
jgi:hypothetical protein